MQEKELITSGKEGKQTISNWVLRKRRIKKEVIPIWEKYLGVPSKFFVDDDGYCKELSDNEQLELEHFLVSQPYNKSDSRLISEIEVPERRLQISTDIKRLQNAIKSDINSTALQPESVYQFLDEAESNIAFYEKVLSLHEKRVIQASEWQGLFQALSCIAFDMDSNSLGTNSLSYKIYEAIRTHREESVEKSDFRDFKELFE